MGKKREIKIINGLECYKCVICKEFKSEKDFENRGGKERNRLRSECKQCRNKESAYYHRTARLRMSPKEALLDIERTNKWRSDPLITLKRYLLRICKSNSKAKGKEFNLTLDDIVVPEICPILGVKFNPNSTWYTYSIDRVDNTKGYIKGNIQIITRLANVMKNVASNEELLAFAKNIQNYIKR